MNIGQAARASGVSAKMIRYYESVGLTAPAQRSGANYRSFSERDVEALRFIKRARELDFPVAEIARLLSLWRDASRCSREVKAIAQQHVAELEARIARMQAMAVSLRRLAEGCAGDERPDCPILRELGLRDLDELRPDERATH